MRLMKRIVTGTAGALVLGIVGGLAWITIAPPQLLRVGSGYAAKIVCSNVFLAGRDPQEVLAIDVQAPGNPLLLMMRVTVDRDAGRVDAGLLGFIGTNQATYRPRLGCTVSPDGSALPQVALPPRSSPSVDEAPAWPVGQGVERDPRVMAVLEDKALTGPGMRAVVVVKNGRIVGEAYGEGFSKDTPLLGWSMTKTVNAALIGTLMNSGRMSLGDRDLLPAWSNDKRREITLANLLAMESGLGFNENYGAVADVTRMLYLEPDMAAFTATIPLEADPGARFRYSSGSSVLLSKIWMDRIGDRATALGYPSRALFDPLGMTSAVMEPDAAGTFAGSSYLYATGRDWARFGLFLARDGVWNGMRLLPDGFVHLMQEPNAHSGGRFSEMQTWLPKANDNMPLPADTFYLQGHDGQTIAVMPSSDLVVVRLGLTPRSLGYEPGLLFGAVAKATGVAGL